MKSNTNTLPADVQVALQKIEWKDTSLVAFSMTDLAPTGEFKTGCIVLSKNEVLVLLDSSEEPWADHYFKGFKLPEKPVEHQYEITRLSLEQIERVWMEQGVGCNLLLAKLTDGKEQVLSMFTNLHKKSMVELQRALEWTKQGKTDAEGKEIPFEPKEERDEYCPKCGRMYPDKLRKICPHCMDKRNVFFRVLSYFKPYKLKFAGLFVATLLTALLNLVVPYLNGTILYDKILAKNEAFLQQIGIEDGRFVTALLILVLTMATTNILLLLLQILQGVWTAQMVVDVIKDMKQDVFRVMGKLSISFFKSRQTGGLMTRVMSDADRITGFFVDGAPWILVHGLTMLVSIIVMFTISPAMTMVTIVMFPVLVAVSMILRPKIWIMYGKRHRAERSLSSAINDNLTGARVVKSFGQEAKENIRFDKVNENLRGREVDITYRQNYFRFMYGAAQSIATMGAWFIGVYLLLGDNPTGLNMGMLLTFVGYVGQLEGPMNFFSRVHNWWADSMNAAQRMFEIIDATPEVVEPLHPVPLPQMKGDIKIQGMTFGYETARPVLKNLNLEIPAGSMYGIVGRSGAGKTTLVNLISRMYDPDEGEILIDGINVRDLSFEELRRNVAMVSQDTYIFAGTVAENIAYANKGAGPREILRAAKLAGAHEFIMRMPDGYDTRIGASGRDLSGGEKQRISIARAILADPKILILDEATASVDTQTEKMIQKSINYLVKGRTTLAIAHRLSTLTDADYLVVIDGGSIAEEGTHAQLVEKQGIYYKLSQLQTQ